MLSNKFRSCPINALLNYLPNMMCTILHLIKNCYLKVKAAINTKLEYQIPIKNYQSWNNPITSDIVVGHF